VPRNTRGLKRTAGPGRPKGRPNQATLELRRLAEQIIDNPEYLQKLTQAMIDRTVAPAVEVMLWAYAKGRPTASVAADRSFTIRWLNAADKEVPNEQDCPGRS
jgi:hypothetical protein